MTEYSSLSQENKRLKNRPLSFMVQFQRSIHSLCSSAAGIAALGLLGICAACSSAPLAQVSETPAPAVAPATLVVASGKIVPDGGVLKISAANAQDSRVNQILVQEGDTVEANQVIAVLQGRDRAQQDLRDAEANVAIKRAQLLKARQGDAKSAELVAQQAAIAELDARLQAETVERQTAITEAEATLRNAELKFQRNQSLQAEGAIKQSDLDDAQEELSKAQATLARTQAELNNTTSTLEAQLQREQANLANLQEVRPVDIEIAQAELEQALIQVEQRKAELDDKLVRVPMAGQILRINTRIGEQVNTQKGIAELGKTDQMYVLAEVYETEITRVRLGQSATIVSEYGGFKEELQGKVDQVGLQIGKAELNQDQSDPKTDVNARVVEVKIRLDAADSRKVAALTEMQVRVKINTSSENAPGNTPAAESTRSDPSDPFAEAVRLAEETAKAGKSAETASEWQELATRWQRASDLMNQIGSEDSRYAVAQDRVEMYRQNGETARQKAEE